jgi:hypothetical protein
MAASRQKFLFLIFSNYSAVPQMRERGLQNVLLHMSRPMTKQMWCC